MQSSKRATSKQLPLPLFERCSKCGQVIVVKPSADPVMDAILRTLRAANGLYVKTGLLRQLIGMKIGRTQLHERVVVLEKAKMIKRNLKHPRSGYKITYKGMQKNHNHQSHAA